MKRRHGLRSTLDQMDPATRDLYLTRNTLLAAMTGCLTAYPIIVQNHAGPDQYDVYHSEGAWIVLLAEHLPLSQATQLRDGICAFADKIQPIRKGDTP